MTYAAIALIQSASNFQDPYLVAVKRPGGKIGFPGGKLEPGETELEAVIREVYEETNLRPSAEPVLLGYREAEAGDVAVFWFKAASAYPLELLPGAFCDRRTAEFAEFNQDTLDALGIFGKPSARRIIVALDDPSKLKLPFRGRSWVAALKIHADSMRQEFEFLAQCSQNLAQPFFDLKLHDIPNTVGNVVRELELGMDCFGSIESGFVTVWADPRAIEAAKAASRRLKVLAVLALSSDPSYESEVLRLAQAAVAAGAYGLIAPPQHLAALRAQFPKVPLVTPGVRLNPSSKDDHTEVLTPYEAIRRGADYIVMGRALLSAPDPQAAFDEAQRQVRAADPPKSKFRPV